MPVVKPCLSADGGSPTKDIHIRDDGPAPHVTLHTCLTEVFPARPRRRVTRTLAALVAIVLPHLRPDVQATVADSVQERIAAAPAAIRDELKLAIAALGSRAAGLLVTRTLHPFADLSPGRRAAAFGQWATSPIPQARTIHQALRRLVLWTWYSTNESHRDLGIEPPLHTREPRFAWEGPLPGNQTLDSEPVARRAKPGPTPGAMPGARAIPAAVVLPATASGPRALQADVVVIGSGAGGAVAACRFAEAGYDVVVLEEGEYLHAPDFTEDEGALTPRLYADQGLRTTVDASIALLQGGVAGGGSTVNWMLMLRPTDEVLEEWSGRHGIPGVGARDLGPHFAKVESEVHARPSPDDAHSPSNRAILAGARALGWRARAAGINARGCVQAGTCGLGCRYDAKQSVLLTYLPRAFASGARLHTGAAVTRIELAERDTGGPVPPLKRVHAAIRDPRTGDVRGQLTIQSPIVVLAAGAVGTPVILERSGLGGGGVGRYLRLHPTTGVMGLYPHDTYPLAGIPQTALCDEFVRRDADGYGFWIECPGLLPALAAASMPGFGDPHHALMRQVRNLAAFIVLVRDGSGPDRSMGSVWVDRRGRTRIRYRMTPADRENLRLGIEAAARLHLAAGASSAMSLHTPPVRVTRDADLPDLRTPSLGPNRVALFSAHVNGTCRLGVNPATSGCAPSGERHGVRGLYVMDGSLLPTAPGVNPQETIMALASLLAERVIG